MTLLNGLSKGAFRFAPLLLAVLVSCKTVDSGSSNQLAAFVPDTKEKSAEGQMVELNEVSGDASKVFKDKLVLGIQANPKAGDNSGHYYVVLNDKRVDGEILRAPKMTAGTFSDGYYIVFDLTKKQLETATKEMNALDQARTLTCVHAALKFIKQMTGYYMGKPEGQRYPNALPGETFALYLREGFGNDAGKVAKTHIYRTNKLPLKQFQTILTLREPEAKAYWENGRIDMKRFELSSSTMTDAQLEAELPPLSCAQLHETPPAPH